MELSSYSNQEWLIPGEEVVTYDSPQDVVKKVVYFLGHQEERERIARAGQRRVFRDHTFVHRFRELITMLS